jgi:outer membrane lipoprotein carrier protein
MIRRQTAAFLLFIGCLLWTGQGLCASTDLLQRIRRNYFKTSNIYIEFEQSIYWNVREKTTKNSGSIALAPGDKFRVVTANDLYVGDGSVCWQFSKNTNQVIIRNFRDLDRSTHPSYLLTTFLDRCRFTEKDRTKKQVILVAAADSTTLPGYSSVEITVQTPSGTVTSLKFTDKNGNVHTYVFKKTVFEKQHSQRHFEFEAPPDADIIDHRK